MQVKEEEAACLLALRIGVGAVAGVRGLDVGQITAHRLGGKEVRNK